MQAELHLPDEMQAVPSLLPFVCTSQTPQHANTTALTSTSALNTSSRRSPRRQHQH
jgi:hypothetical protein